MDIGYKSFALKELTYDGFGLPYAKRTQFRVVDDGTLKAWPCRKLARRLARPTQDRAAQNAKQRGGMAGRDVAGGRWPGAQGVRVGAMGDGRALEFDHRGVLLLGQGEPGGARFGSKAALKSLLAYS